MRSPQSPIVQSVPLACHFLAALALLAGFTGGAAALPAGAGGAPPQENPGPAEKPAAPQSQQAGANAAALTTSMEVLNDTYKFRDMDRASFRIVEERGNPVPLYVTDSGEMEVPYIGRVKARGKTCKQLAFEIKPLLEQEYFKRATVIVALDVIGAKPRGKIQVGGQVKVQSVIELKPDDFMTVSQAIMSAGGLADFADKRKVKLVRKKEGALADPEMIPVAKGRTAKGPKPWYSFWSKKKEVVNDDSTETFIVDLVEILQNGHLEKDPVLKSGDLIFVPERTWNF